MNKDDAILDFLTSRYLFINIKGGFMVDKQQDWKTKLMLEEAEKQKQTITARTEKSREKDNDENRAR
jgi:hypothetical protein